VRWLARFSPPAHEVLLENSTVGACFIDLRETICTQLYLGGRYPHQSGQDLLLRRLAVPGQTVFDLGANIGFYTRLFAGAVGPAGTVVAVEPARRALRLLRLNAGLCAATVHVVPKAVSGSVGRLFLYETKKLDLSYCLPCGSASAAEVATTTIDCLAAEWGPPGLIKIDVEGFEDAVLAGARRTLESDNPPIVMFEHIADLAARCGQRPLDDVLGRFPGGRYKILRVGINGELAEIKSADSAQLSNDYLAVPVRRPPHALPEAP